MKNTDYLFLLVTLIAVLDSIFAVILLFGRPLKTVSKKNLELNTNRLIGIEYKKTKIFYTNSPLGEFNSTKRQIFSI